MTAAPLDAAALNIRITEGNGATYLTGSRATRGITVVITDENGEPVSGAMVSFSLPPDGPSGTFTSGGRTEIVTTRPDGRASAWGMRWNRAAGPLEIRVTAVKGQARAGVTAMLYLTATPQLTAPSSAAVTASAPKIPQSDPAQSGPEQSASQNERTATSRVAQTQHVLGATSKKVTGHKWVWMSLAIAGAAVAGAGIAGHGGSSSSSSAGAVPSTVSIGTPTISLGRP